MHWEGVVSGEATEFRFGFNVHSGGLTVGMWDWTTDPWPLQRTSFNIIRIMHNCVLVTGTAGWADLKPGT